MPEFKSLYKSVPAIVVLFCLSADLRAELPHGADDIAAGKPAVALHIRENFEYLDERVVELGQMAADQSNGVNQDVALDCDAEPDAFLNAPINSYTTYILTGMCNGPIWISERQNITIKGDEAGSKDDGVILPGGLSEHPYAVIGVWESKNIALENLTISAANYVSANYSFGDNVAALGAGDASHVEVTDVAFLGGDYAVDVYRNAIVRLREGVSVTGFNRAGLNAFMGAHIRTDADITVTGIVDDSTDDYIPAINAVANGTVQIRNGGTFTAGSTTRTVDSSGFDIYPAAVWAGDNGTIRVNDGNNPTVFNGAVEAGYSAMIRLRGTTVIHGVFAAYHSSVIHATNVVQDSGEVWVGDGGYLRVESSTLTPGDTDGYVESIGLYRSGRARFNNSTLNLGGINIYAYGFTVLNLRGTTNLGTDGVDCGERNNVSISDSVTHGPISCW